MGQFTQQYIQRISTNTMYNKPKTETLTSKIHIQNRSVKNYMSKNWT